MSMNKRQIDSKANLILYQQTSSNIDLILLLSKSRQISFVVPFPGFNLRVFVCLAFLLNIIWECLLQSHDMKFTACITILERIEGICGSKYFLEDDE